MDFKLLSNTYGWNYVKYFTLCRPLALNEVYLVEESSFYTDEHSKAHLQPILNNYWMRLSMIS